MTTQLEGYIPHKKEDIQKYITRRWWAGLTIGDILDKAADVYPGYEAVIDRANRLSFSEVAQKANQLAVSLMKLGIQPQERVLVQLPNWYEFAFAYFALQKIGAIVVLLIDRYRQYEVNHLFKLTGATSWIVPEQYQKMNYLPVIEDVLKENPQAKNVILVRGKGGHKNYLSMENLITEGKLTEKNLGELTKRRPDPTQVAHMGPTGGTTGLPKVVPRTHNDILCCVEYANLAWELGHNDVCLVAGPVGHDFGFTKGFLGSFFTYGKCVLLDSTDLDDICQTMQREKVTAIPWVPTLAGRLVHYEGLKKYDLSSLRVMHVGGAAATPDLIKDVIETFKCVFINAYGGTEGHSTMTRSFYDFETTSQTVGRPTCPYDTYKVVDSKGNSLPPNTIGELELKGPGVFSGYYKAPEENKKVFDAEGFFKTGDLARIDDKGNIVLTGRMKEMINRGGESISATEIERLIVHHPRVEMVAVIPMPDPVMGEKVCAYIQPKPGTPPGFNEIISFLKSQGASVLHLPERMEFVDSIPLSKTGKVDKKYLMEDIKKRMGLS